MRYNGLWLLKGVMNMGSEPSPTKPVDTTEATEFTEADDTEVDEGLSLTFDNI